MAKSVTCLFMGRGGYGLARRISITNAGGAAKFRQMQPAAQIRLPPFARHRIVRRMKTLRLALIALLFTIGLSGCLQIEKVVKLKPDGSGTVEETVVMGKEVIAQMQQMAAGFGDLGGKKAEKPADKGFELMDEKKLKDAADKMGDGVTFVSAKKIDNNKGSGFTAVYAFADINKLKLDQNPGDAMPSPGGVKAGEPPGGKKQEPVTFKFAKGSPAELVVKMPTPEMKQPEKKEQAPGMEDMAMQMMKQMFKDMKITMAVEVAGTITETNAEYKDGSRVTLMEMDFNKLLADPEKFKQLAKESPKTLQESKALMKGIDGVKIETAPEVKIRYLPT